MEEKKHLSAKGLLTKVRTFFNSAVQESSNKSGKPVDIPLVDCLMSGLAIFGLKYPSLLQFDKGRNEEVICHNLKTLYGVGKAPCDTQLRTRLDSVDPRSIRGAFTQAFASLQRSKALEKYQLIDNYYLLLADGTGYFSSKTVHCKNCCERNHTDGSKTYYHLMLGAVIAHPDYKEVIPLCPEPIIKEDGAKKNDCETSARKRLLSDIRREHPHLPLILVEDALFANVPHIRLCQKHDIRFKTVVKKENNKIIFE